MANKKTSSSKSATPAPTSARGRELALSLARVAADTRCTNVVVLDVSHLSPVTDFFVIGTGTSARQMRTACDDCAEVAEGTGYKAISTNGYEGSSWICVDFVDVILHVFSDEARAFYDLENLWAEARQVDWANAK